MVNNNEMLIDAIMEQLPSFSVGINNPKDPGNYDYARGIAESIAEVVTVHYQPNIISKKCDGKQTCRASCATLLDGKDEEIRQLTARVEARDNEIARLKIAMGVPAYEADCEIKLLNEMLAAKDAEINRMAAVIEEMQPIEAMITLREENTAIKAKLESQIPTGNKTCCASCCTLLEQAREGLEKYTGSTYINMYTENGYMQQEEVDCGHAAREAIAAINAATGKDN